ncbi:hypothetical protein ACIO8F_04845 [Streptomyces sp. NPDC087228]|uniref:hypothetical protein n=1 Tax=Streptomyces sp. NPDC087228 TaxID=3365772 RepID=UPI003817AFC2
MPLGRAPNSPTWHLHWSWCPPPYGASGGPGGSPSPPGRPRPSTVCWAAPATLDGIGIGTLGGPAPAPASASAYLPASRTPCCPACAAALAFGLVLAAPDGSSPGRGRTAAPPLTEQRRIALLGGAGVRRTGVGPEAAVVAERRADPYREQPLSARIVGAVHAYDDLSGEGLIGPPGALERLGPGTVRDCRPEVVESLARVLARSGLAPVPHG